MAQSPTQKRSFSAAAAADRSGVLSLCADIWAHVAEFLARRDVLRLSNSSRDLRNIALSNGVWEWLLRRDFSADGRLALAEGPLGWILPGGLPAARHEREFVECYRRLALYFKPGEVVHYRRQTAVVAAREVDAWFQFPDPEREPATAFWNLFVRAVRREVPHEPSICAIQHWMFGTSPQPDLFFTIARHLRVAGLCTSDIASDLIADRQRKCSAMASFLGVSNSRTAAATDMCTAERVRLVLYDVVPRLSLERSIASAAIAWRHMMNFILIRRVLLAYVVSCLVSPGFAASAPARLLVWLAVEFVRTLAAAHDLVVSSVPVLSVPAAASYSNMTFLETSSTGASEAALAAYSEQRAATGAGVVSAIIPATEDFDATALIVIATLAVASVSGIRAALAATCSMRTPDVAAERNALPLLARNLAHAGTAAASAWLYFDPTAAFLMSGITQLALAAIAPALFVFGLVTLVYLQLLKRRVALHDLFVAFSAVAVIFGHALRLVDASFAFHTEGHLPDSVFRCIGRTRDDADHLLLGLVGLYLARLAVTTLAYVRIGLLGDRSGTRLHAAAQLNRRGVFGFDDGAYDFLEPPTEARMEGPLLATVGNAIALLAGLHALGTTQSAMLAAIAVGCSTLAVDVATTISGAIGAHFALPRLLRETERRLLKLAATPPPQQRQYAQAS